MAIIRLNSNIILNKDKEWLEKQTKKQGIKDTNKIFLATLDQDENLSIYMKLHFL